MLRRGAKHTLIALAIASATACAGGVERRDEASPEMGADGQTVQVVIGLQDLAAPFYAPFYVASQKGYFASHGIEATFVYRSGTDLVRDVASGAVTFGFPNAADAVAGFCSGLPGKVIHTTYQAGVSAMVTVNPQIQTVADLKGRTVAVTSLAGSYFNHLQALLESAGLSVRDVSVQTLPPNAIVDALSQGRVDAMVYAEVRALDLQDRGIDARVLGSGDAPSEYGNVVIATDATLTQGDLASRFVRALDKGTRDVVASPDEAVDIALEQAAPPFKERAPYVERGITELYAPKYWEGDDGTLKDYGVGDPAKWDALREELLRRDTVRTCERSSEDIFTNEYLS